MSNSAVRMIAMYRIISLKKSHFDQMCHVLLIPVVNIIKVKWDVSLLVKKNLSVINEMIFGGTSCITWKRK